VIPLPPRTLTWSQILLALAREQDAQRKQDAQGHVEVRVEVPGGSVEAQRGAAGGDGHAGGDGREELTPTVQHDAQVARYLATWGRH
jgi:hypothetical protein